MRCQAASHDATGERMSRSELRHRQQAASFCSAAPGAAIALIASLPGVALAADLVPPQPPAPPPLPSPPEVVRTLSGTLFSGPGDAPPTEEAPSLKEGSNGSGKNGDPVAAKKDNGSQKEQGLSKQDEELETRFETQILPKIQEQLKALDQNEAPNAATIELKRQLRRAEDDIYRLLDDLKGRKSDAARAEAAGLAREFEDIREYVRKNGGSLADEEN